MIRTFAEHELIRIEDKAVEKEWAFPNLTGEQNALMLVFENGQWTVSGWGASIDAVGQEACGWEPLCEGDLALAMDYLGTMAKVIEEGEQSPFLTFAAARVRMTRAEIPLYHRASIFVNSFFQQILIVKIPVICVKLPLAFWGWLCYT